MNTSTDKEIERIKYLTEKYKELLKTPRFKSYSEEEMWNLLLFGESINLDESITLGGEIRCVGNKIEMSPILMISLIKSKGHTITKDEKSNKEMCILHGERGDNGNPWTVSFSRKEVDTGNQLPWDPRWKTHPEEKLFCRALSQLAFYLFTDVIGSAGVDGDLEIERIIMGNKGGCQWGLSELQIVTWEGLGFHLWTPAEIAWFGEVREEYEKKPIDYDINQLFKVLEE